jgi:hypothetical protein
MPSKKRRTPIYFACIDSFLTADEWLNEVRVVVLIPVVLRVQKGQDAMLENSNNTQFA